MVPTPSSSPRETLGYDERRTLGRYEFPLSLLIDARWNGRPLPLKYAPRVENISGGGLTLCVARGPLPPVNAQLEIRIPLMERAFQASRLWAQCRGRVLRREDPDRVAVIFEDIRFVRDDRPTGIPEGFFACA